MDKHSAFDIRLENYPCRDQTEDDLTSYYRSVQEGDVAVVKQTQYHHLGYHFMRITGTNPKRGRVYVDHFGAFYAKSGKNCFHPKGQTTLVVPSPDILRFNETHERMPVPGELSPDEVRQKLGYAVT